MRNPYDPMDKKGQLSFKDYIGIITMLFGSIGFILWGLGIGIENLTLTYYGRILVGSIALFLTVVSKWL